MNPYMLEAREAKAAKLADVLVRCPSADAETVACIPAEVRRLAERIAGVRQASDETWARVAEMLAERRAEKMAA